MLSVTYMLFVLRITVLIGVMLSFIMLNVVILKGAVFSKLLTNFLQSIFRTGCLIDIVERYF
jgi:hypothetical protein